MLVVLVTVLMGILLVLGLASSQRSVDVARRLEHAHVRSHGLDACRNAIEEAATGFFRVCHEGSPMAPATLNRADVGGRGRWIAFSTGALEAGEGDRKLDRLRWALVNDPASFRGEYRPTVASRALAAPYGAEIEIDPVDFRCLAWERRGQALGGTLSLRVQALMRKGRWKASRSLELRWHFWVFGTRIRIEEAPLGSFVDQDAEGGSA